MKDISRRSFFKSVAVLAAGAAAPAPARGEGREPELSPDRKGVLVDTTACIGCRNCEWACRTAHDLPTPPVEAYEDRSVFKDMRRPNEGALTVVNVYENAKKPGWPDSVKVQCMHCDHPACVSACIVGALKKKESGAVVWDTDKCIGCRYCMIACPFQIPAFEYKKAIQPKVVKCDFCWTRQEQGKLPACVERCPNEALTFGRREDVIRAARERIKRSPERYADKVYGEFEVGGTSWVYITSRDAVADLKFPKLGRSPAPGVSESIQEGVFAYFVPPVALYSLLGLIMWTSKDRPKDGEGD